MSSVSKINKIKRWIELYSIKNYMFDENDYIHVFEDVNLQYSTNSITNSNLPFKFYKISGNFNISHLHFNSLKNCPNIVDGDFNISFMDNLKNLQHCPITISGYLMMVDKNERFLKNNLKYIPDVDVMINNKIIKKQVINDMKIQDKLDLIEESYKWKTKN